MDCQKQEDLLLEKNYDAVKSICLKYNNEHSDSAIDLDKYTTTIELIFNLWVRNISLGTLGEIIFNKAINDDLSKWCSFPPEDNKNPYNIEENVYYKTYLYIEEISNYLYYSLLLYDHPGYYGCMKQAAIANMAHLKDFLIDRGHPDINNYTDFRRLLKKKLLTKMQLTHLVWICDDHGLGYFGSFLDNVIEICES